MTEWIEEDELQGIVRRHEDLPATVWVQDTPTRGHKEPLTPANAEAHGFMPILLAAEPRPDAPNDWSYVKENLTRTPAGWQQAWETVTGTPDIAQELDAEVLTEAEGAATFGVVAVALVTMEKMLSRLGEMINEIADVVDMADGNAKNGQVVNILERWSVTFRDEFRNLEAQSILELQSIKQAPEARQAMMRMKYGQFNDMVTNFLGTAEGQAWLAANS